MAVKCLDTYAIYEILKGNPKFMKYSEGDFVFPNITLAELYGLILRTYNELTAEYWRKKLEPYARQVDMALLIEAAKFKNQNKKSKMSYFDALGYVFARENGYKFVTGDKEFENFKGVEFQKK